jgi:hypothetical protein
LLAVTVSNTASGDWLIAGDTATDVITIAENADGTQWEIVGFVTPLTPLVADLDPVRSGLQIPKPTTQNVLILLDGGGDGLTMLGINRGSGANAVIFVGQTTIDMGAGSNSVDLGSFREPSPSGFGANANNFIGAVSVNLGGDATSTDRSNVLRIENTNFGRAAGTPVSGRLDIAGGLGGDVVLIRDAINFGGSINIHTGAGSDLVTVGVVFPQFRIPEAEPPGTSPQDAVQLGGSLNIDVGEGDDDVAVGIVLAIGNLMVSGGAGDDNIRFGEINPSHREASSTQGDIIVHGGDGDDDVSIQQATSAGALHVALGDGATAGDGNRLNVNNSSFSAASSVSGGAQIDKVGFGAVNSPLGLHIQTAGGNDEVGIGGTLVELGVVSIVSGAGDDRVFIGQGSRLHTLIIASGDGNDTVLFGRNIDGNAAVEVFFLDLGAGDDTVDSADSTFRRAFAQGGDGTDTRLGQAFTQENEDDFLFFEGFNP